MEQYQNEVGARGIGEIGLAGFAAAITDAVHHATGIRRAGTARKNRRFIGLKLLCLYIEKGRIAIHYAAEFRELLWLPS